MIFAALCKYAWIAAVAPFCAPTTEAYVGYVEGEYVAVAPIDVARIDSQSVRRGDVLKAGETIARLETADAEIALRNAEAALAQAKADLANLQKGRRPEEIAALEATLKSVEATAEDTQRTFERRQKLLDRGYASQAEYDAAKTAFEVATARVRELTANLAVAKLPARSDEIDSASAKVKQAQAACETAKWRLDQRTLARPQRRLCLRHHPPRRRRRRPAGARRLVPAGRRDQAEDLRARGAGSPASISGSRWTCAATAAHPGFPPTSPISPASPSSPRPSSTRCRAGRRSSISSRRAPRRASR